MMASFLPVIVSEKSKQAEKNMSFIAVYHKFTSILKKRRYPGTCPGGNEDLNAILGPWHTSIHHASILTITTIYHHAIT